MSSCLSKPENSDSGQNAESPRSPWRMLALGLITAAGAAFVFCVMSLGLSNQDITQKDFIQYWAIGQQLAHHASPYDVAAIVQMERSMGLGSSPPRISLSPPTIWWPMLPLGLFSPKTGYILWLFLLIGCLAWSVRLLWRLNGSPDNLVYLFGLFFAPAMICMMAGQLSIFLLLGIVLFLHLHNSRPALAGASLLPCAFKPHLFILFACVLVLWAIYRRTFRVLFGAVAALLASCVITLAIDVHAWSEYSRMMKSTRIMQVFIPTFGDALRFLLNRNAVELQFVPAVIGGIWAIWYFWTYRQQWDWTKHGLLLLFFSDVCAPYGFVNDECILLPLLFFGLYRAIDPKRSFMLFAIVNVIALAETLSQVDINSPYYLWTAPAWLGWFLYSRGKSAFLVEPADARTGA
jgi:Glycosyltransferase family 87